MESEDAAEGERKEAEMKVESLTSIVKMFELKAKNSQEQSEYMSFKCILLSLWTLLHAKLKWNVQWASIS